ncbi:MAG: tetratricopeptide repeat protein [Acidobacteriota bacterium]
MQRPVSSALSRRTANPSTELSDNAQFWIGESRYARGDIRGALAAFRETLQRYPDGNTVPDAMIKEGDCLASLGDRDGARSRYEEVIRRFGSSAAAIMAEERLAALD